MLSDLRFAFRMIAAHRWFSAAIIATLALGIGINTTVFTLVNAVLFKPVPLPNGARLVTVSHQNAAASSRDRFTGIAHADFLEYQAQNRSFEALEALAGTQATLSETNNPPERYRGARVSAGLLAMIQTPPVLGRGFTATDTRPGAEPVLVISHRVWQNRYGGDPAIVGRAVRMNGTPSTIVGVMPEGFQFPGNEDVWLPLVPLAGEEKREQRPFQLFGLMRADIDIAAANTDLALIFQRLATSFPDTNRDLTAAVRTFHETYNGNEIRAIFLMMLGAVGFVLLIACANVANMMLSRSVGRAREIAVRAAMGASRGQLIRQLLVESVLLSTLGGLCGLGLALVGVRAFDLAVADVGKPYWIHFDMDLTAFGYFAAISILSGIVFGLLPALRASRVDLNTALKDGSQSGGSARGGKLTATLVVLQFALTVVLLAGAGLMVRSFFAVQTVNSFVRAESVFTARIQLPEGPGERYAQPLSRLQFYEKLVPELAALPGVTQVGVASNFPALGNNTRDIEIEGQPAADPKRLPRASFIVQTPGYLRAIGLPILSGRDFEETDGDTGKEAAIVTRSFAARYWPNESALGKRFRFVEGDKPVLWMTVVGVSADIVQNLQDADAPPTVFISYRQESWGWMGILLRASGDPAALTNAVRAAVQNVDPDLPLFEVRTLTAALERQRWFLNVFGTLFSVFALTGLLMASIGIYAVVAQSTARRTREIGIRMALGATAGRIAQLVLSRGLLQLGLGVALGLAAALVTTRVLTQSGVLMRVSPNDPTVFGAITALLLVIGLFACWLPARRAAALHPVKALRHE